MSKKEIWKKLVTKAFHASHFSATAKPEALRLELKIKTRYKAIATSAIIGLTN